MTRNRATSLGGQQSDRWMLQDAKARFSEVVRRAHDVGPQHVSVRGHDAVVIVSEAEYGRLKQNQRTGVDLIAALRSIPGDDLMLEPEGIPMPVREVDFP